MPSGARIMKVVALVVLNVLAYDFLTRTVWEAAVLRH